MSKGLQIAVGATLVVLLLGWYAVTNTEGARSFVYYKTLEEFRAAGSSPTPARIHGFVAPGTIQRDVASRVVRFSVQSAPPHAGSGTGDALPVVYASLEVPDLFKDGAEVVVEGQLLGETAVFHATNVMAKCPSKFEPQTEASL